ncbi:hypothetical protein [uncultured Alistipes sp.]|uniref:hypothetical protein n=1 Tax=uncultured Alistipes sp. TaxID=538949 RepID=UPI0025D10B40|nr:hypothetical protein [uncultured Alistipes sp.]
MKRFLLAACLFTATVGFTACSSDRDDVFDTLAGRVWIGDLGFYDGRYPLDSYIYFGSDGFGDDELYYNDNGQFFGRFNIQWQVSNNRTLYISYGNVAPPRELRRISIRRRTLEGDLYINGVFYDYVTLYMK